MVFSAKSLEKNASQMRDLISETISHVRFDEKKRIQELIQLVIARNEEAISSNGHGQQWSMPLVVYRVMQH